MQPTAGWWCAAERRLFGWLHLPPDGAARGGVVLCPPLLDEPYWTRGTYRILAERLAASGFVALSIDYWGTGDSSGEPEQVTDVQQWRCDISSAAAELRRGGAPFVAGLGMRAAANLLSDTDHGDFDAFVLWDPAPGGRAYLRRLQLLRRLAGDGSDPVDQTGGIEGTDSATRASEELPDVGYDYPPSLVASLRRLPPCSATSPPSLLLLRGGRRPAGVRIGPQTDVIEARGQLGLLETHLDAVTPPEQSVRDVVDWMHRHAPQVSVPVSVELAPSWRDGEISERVVLLGDDSAVFGIVTEPADQLTADREPLTCLMLNSGAQYHIGPQRLHVSLARQLAGDGIRSLRLDFRGVGDSGSPPPARITQPPPFGGITDCYGSWCLEDLDVAIQQFGSGPLVAIGLCSGGYHALEAAARWPLKGAIAIHLSGELGWRLGMLSSDGTDRPVAQAISDRRWLRTLRRFRYGRAVARRIPGIFWYLFDALGAQADLSRGVQTASRNGAEIVVFLERAESEAPGAWALVHRRRPDALLINEVDHDLFALAGHRQVREECRRRILSWAMDPPSGHRPATVDGRAPRL